MKNIIQFLENKFLVKKNINVNDDYLDDKYICVGWGDNFSDLYSKSDYLEYLDTDEDKTENPAAFIMNKKQIKEYAKYIDDIYYIPQEYLDNIKQLLDDWWDEKILINQLKSAQISEDILENKFLVKKNITKSSKEDIATVQFLKELFTSYGEYMGKAFNGFKEEWFVDETVWYELPISKESNSLLTKASKILYDYREKRTPIKNYKDYEFISGSTKTRLVNITDENEEVIVWNEYKYIKVGKTTYKALFSK